MAKLSKDVAERAKKKAKEIGIEIKQLDGEDFQRITRISQGLKRYAEYFNPRKTSISADKLSGWLRFLAMNAPGAKIDRLTLFSFDKFFRQDGEVRIAMELEKVREVMLKRSKIIHTSYDDTVKTKISKLQKDLEESTDKEKSKEIVQEIKQLEEFLALPGDLEIRTSSIDEISNRLKARNIKSPGELNQPPDGGLFRMALNDCTIEGRWDGSKMNVTSDPYRSEHFLTYALNVNLKNPDIVVQAREWWNFSMQAMGADGAMKFYQMIGYLLVTKYPLPTERTILVLIGDSGSGKGTHLAAVQGILTFDTLTLFAKAGPHKLADTREHFSKQNLQNKLALIDGDMNHIRIHDFSAVNDLFGGEPSEMERKFKDPTVERPIFKGLWASAPPLFRITQAGGAWRRLLLIILNRASKPDNSLKPKMLNMLDGFFLNGLIGLSYLVSQGWTFTGEQDNDTVEKLWNFQADSVQVWAQNLMPEPDKIEAKQEVRGGTLDVGSSEKVMVENFSAIMVVDELYQQYEAWCKKKQVEPVKPKTLSSWLGRHDYIIKRKVVEEGPFKGERKYITYASWDGTYEQSGNSKMNRTRDQFTWEAYFSKAPLSSDIMSDSFGQIPPHEKEKKSGKYDHVYRLPQRIGHESEPFPEPRNSGLADDITPCPIQNQDSMSPKLQPREGKDSDIQKSQPDPTNSEAQKHLSKKTHMIESTHASGLHEESSKSDVQNQSAITEDEGKKIIQSLLNSGIPVLVKDSGKSVYNETFKIAIPKAHYDKHKESLETKMRELYFTRINKGEMGTVFFTIQLRGDEKK
jgi:phage/plasmid-associated DNA primase